MGHLHLEPLDFLGKLDSLAVGERSVATWFVDAKDLGQEVQDWLALVEGSGRNWRSRKGGRKRWREEREGGREAE